MGIKPQRLILHYINITLLLITPLLLPGCSDSIEDHIAQLVEGGEGAEEAKIRLNLAKKPAIDPLIRAFQNRDLPSQARVSIAQALYRLYLRETDERILESLIGGMKDPDTAVRAGVVRSLGDMRQQEGVGPLINQLERERDDAVRLEILAALEIIGIEGFQGTDVFLSEIKTDKMTTQEKGHFITILGEMTQEDLSDSLRLKTQEWLEILAEEKAVKAHQRTLQADLQGAQALLLSARDLIPDSKNINQKLGRFYYDNGDQEKGLKILTEIGMVAPVHKLRIPPQIDGVLNEPAWQDIRPLRELYQCIFTMRAFPTEGKADIYIGYHGNNLYLGVRGYEASTEHLAATVTERDGDVYLDDCVEIFMDTNHDYRSYYQIMVNSLGTITDSYNDGSQRTRSWNATYHAATKVEDTFWNVEIEIPATQLHQGTIKSGDVWGFNVARVRIANASEYGQWIPTYGSAHRPDRFGFMVFE